MTFPQMIHTFFHDDKIRVAIVLIFFDFVFGVSAALKQHKLNLAYLSAFLHTDVLKLAMYFGLYAGALVAGGAKLVIPGVDLGWAAMAAYAVLVTSFGGSIISSLKELGFSVPGLASISNPVTPPQPTAVLPPKA